MVIHGYSRLYLVVIDCYTWYRWLLVVIDGYTWLWVVNTLLYMVICGYRLLCVVIQGYTWLLVFIGG